MAKEYSADFLEQLKLIVEERDIIGAIRLLEDLHPADIADLVDEMDTEDAEFVLKVLDDQTAAGVLVEMEDESRHDMLEHMDSEDIAKHLENLDTDDAVDLIQELDEEDRQEVIASMDDMEQAGEIIDLMRYDEDTAGGVMGTEMVVVNENWSMPECVEQMRMQAEDKDEIYNVYVVDDDNVLQGVLPIRKLITHPSAEKIKYVMEDDPVVAEADLPIDDVAVLFEKYDLAAIPVVDASRRLLGRITFDDIMDRVREQTEHDYQLASGISEEVTTTDSIFTQTRARLPWLLIGIFGGLGSAAILGRFESGIATHPTMALFIPLIGATGGNVGIQSSAIVVQGLANGTLALGRTWKHLLKEIGVGLVNALLISLIVFGYNCLMLTPQNPTTIAVAVSLFALVMFASLFGTLVPLMLERFKIDPALATGPFITITSDIIGVLIYMVSAQSIMQMF